MLFYQMNKLTLYYPITNFYFSQRFGENLNPLYKKLGMTGHNGEDLACASGVNVRSAHEGYVHYCGWAGDAGWRIDIMSNETMEYKGQQVYFMCVYMHNLPNFPVKVGQKIKTGDIIASAGSTGASTGPHCHISLLPMIKEGNVYMKLEPDNGYSGCINPNLYWTGKTAYEVAGLYSKIQELKQQIWSILNEKLTN